MVLHGGLPFGFVLVGLEAQRQQSGVDLPVCGAEHWVSGGGVDGRMNGRIEPVIGRQIASRESGQHFVVQGFDFGQLGLRDAFGRQLARLGLQAGDDFKGVSHVGLAQFQRNGAAVWQQLHQALGGQPLDGFAQWRARDFQHLAELALIELGAGRNATFNQHFAQPLGHLLVQVGA